MPELPDLPDFWPASGFNLLARTHRHWLRPTDAYLRLFVGMPELTLVPESCAAETALHAALVEAPTRAVASAELASIADADARSNYATYLRFRDTLLSAGTLETWYLGLMRSGVVGVPPAFVDRVVQAIVRNLLEGCTDAFEARAAELLFRAQRVWVADGRVLCADRDEIDMYQQTAGLGDIGRLLLQGGAPVRTATMDVLTAANAPAYWQRGDRFTTVLDLTHELTNDLGHGLRFTMAHTHSGLAALARVLRRWVAHFLGVEVNITVQQRIDDDAWRWHIGLDATSMALLNNLYEQRPVEPPRMEQLISLFRLDFVNAAEAQPDMAERPVYLGLAMAADGTLKLKPQNLLLNLPLASTM